MGRCAGILLGTSLIIALLLAPAADASGRRICYADSESGVFVRNTTCRVASALTGVIAKRYDFSLKPFKIDGVHGNWGCTPYIHGRWHDVVCRSGDRAVGVGIK